MICSERRALNISLRNPNRCVTYPLSWRISSRFIICQSENFQFAKKIKILWFSPDFLFANEIEWYIFTINITFMTLAEIFIVKNCHEASVFNCVECFYFPSTSASWIQQKKKNSMKNLVLSRHQNDGWLHAWFFFLSFFLFESQWEIFQIKW